MKTSTIKSISIEDDLSVQQERGIEVAVTLSDGSRRWCYVMTPTALSSCGDWVDGTEIRLHAGARHMIVLAATITADLIEKALKTIERSGELLECTKAM